MQKDLIEGLLIVWKKKFGTGVRSAQYGRRDLDRIIDMISLMTEYSVNMPKHLQGHDDEEGC
jgi:hypothetical protein